MNNKSDVVVRLIAKDEGLKKALNEAGPAGQKALRQIEQASKKAAPSLKAVDNVTADLKKSMNGLLDRLGPVGSALRGLGPIGAGIGVGLAAAAGAALAAANAGEKAAKALAEIGDTAEEIGIATDAYQALRFEADGLRISQDELNSALLTANKTTAEAALGSGEFFSNLINLNPEMVAQVQNSDNLNDRLAAISKGYREAETEVERTTILLRTFGDSGAQAGKALLTLEGGIEGATNRAKDAGVVFSEELIESAQEAAAAIEQADRKIEASKQRLGIAFKDFSVKAKEAQAFFINQIASFGAADTLEQEVFKIEKAQERFLFLQKQNSIPPAIRALYGVSFAKDAAENSKRLEELKRQIEDIDRAKRNEATFQSSSIIALPEEDNAKVTAALQASLNRLRAEATTNAERLAERLEELDQARAAGLVTSDAEYNRLRATLTERFKDVDAIRKQAENERALAAAQAEATRAAQKAAEVRASLGDITGRLSAKEKELDALVASGNLTLDERNRALTQFRENLDGTTEARRKLTEAFQSSLDPVVRFNQETAALIELQNQANIPADKFNQILSARADQLAELEQQQQNQLETDQFGETLEAAEERIKQSLLSAQEIIEAKIETERQIVDALVNEGVLSSDEAASRLTQYRDELEGITDQTGLLGLANDALSEAIGGLTDGMSEFEKIGVQALLAIGAEAFGLEDQLGGIFGGGGAGGAGGGLGNVFGSVLASVFHGGSRSVGRTNAVRRQVSPAAFMGAPRFHSGTARVARDEVPAILRVGERVSTESETRELVNAINRSTALSAAGAAGQSRGALRVTVNNFGSENVTTDSRENSDGTQEIMIEIGKRVPRMVLDTLSGPDGQRVMRDQFGVRPQFGS